MEKDRNIIPDEEKKPQSENIGLNDVPQAQENKNDVCEHCDGAGTDEASAAMRSAEPRRAETEKNDGDKNAAPQPAEHIVRKKVIQDIKTVVLFVMLCFGVAVSYYTFITPNHFAPGGIYGIGSMIQNKTVGVSIFGRELKNGIPWAVPMVMLSIPLIIASAIVLDKKSAVVIAALVVGTNLCDVVLEVIDFPRFVAEEPVQKMFSAAVGGMLTGITFAITLKHFGTADGTVAIAAIVKKKRPQANIAWLTFAFDAVVVAASLFVYWKDNTAGVSGGFNAKFVAAMEPIMYSIINMFFVSKFCDIILKGLETAYKFEVVTDEPEKLSHILMQKLQRGVTAVPAKGMYSGMEKSIVICIVPKKQIGDFKKILKDFPNSFAYITSANEVMGYYER